MNTGKLGSQFNEYQSISITLLNLKNVYRQTELPNVYLKFQSPVTEILGCDSYFMS